MISLVQAVRRKLTGTYPRLPWIPFAAAKAIDSRIDRSFRVWEVGAGYSTLWLSDRVGHVTSIEAHEGWYKRLSEIIAKEAIQNVDLRFEYHAAVMSRFDELPDESLDLLFIDAGPRNDCLKNGWRKVKRGGLIYCDNWENRDFWLDAREWLSENRNQFSEAESFIDYVPAQVGVYEGLLLTRA
jgi:predicted O-methyltransferase YrrM